MYSTNSDFKKIKVTVNGQPVGNGLVLDSITFRPITGESEGLETLRKSAVKS